MRAACAALGLLAAIAMPATAAEQINPPAFTWSHSGPFGTFDREALQRGFTVYRTVCAGCHSLRYFTFRNLAEIGYDAEQIADIAAEYEIIDGPDDDGEMFQRSGRAADRMPAPFANEQAARAANGGALPPDLSLIVKARVGGEDYLRALLTGYADAPGNMEMAEGMSYNAYFPGQQIAMPPPLSDGAVTHADGSSPSVQQMAADVSTFLAWVAEPNLEARKRIGVRVILFLLVLTAILFALKRRIWADVH